MSGEKKSGRKWLYWFSLVASLIIIYKILDSFSSIENWLSNLFSVLTPFIVGIIIAYILYVPSKKIEKFLGKVKIIKKRARGISVFITYLIFFAVIVIAIRFLIPPLVESFQDLVNNFQEYYVGIRYKITELPEDSVLKSEFVTNTLNNFTNFKIEDYINLERMTQYAQGVISFASGIFDIFVAIVVSIYLLLERGHIVGFFKRFIEAISTNDVYKSVGMYFRKSNEIFCNFLMGQLSDAIVVGVLASIAMSIMGVKYAIMLGIFIGIFNMIPYFGAIIAVVISIFITILTGGVSQAVQMAIVIIILQQIDSNIINPKIIGDSVKIRPLLVIFSVTVGGAYFGVLGMFLAVPVAAIIKILMDDFIELKTKKRTRALQKEAPSADITINEAPSQIDKIK